MGRGIVLARVFVVMALAVPLFYVPRVRAEEQPQSPARRTSSALEEQPDSSVARRDTGAPKRLHRKRSATPSEPLAIWQRDGLPPVVVRASGEVTSEGHVLFQIAKDETAVRAHGQWRAWLRPPERGRFLYVDLHGETLLTHDGVTATPCGFDEGSSQELRLEPDGTVTLDGMSYGAWFWHQPGKPSRAAILLVTFSVLQLEASGGRTIEPPCELMRAYRLQVGGVASFAIGYGGMVTLARIAKDWRFLIPIAGPFFVEIPEGGAEGGLGGLLVLGLAASGFALQVGGLIMYPLGLSAERDILRRQEATAQTRGVWPEVQITGSNLQLEWTF